MLTVGGVPAGTSADAPGASPTVAETTDSFHSEVFAGEPSSGGVFRSLVEGGDQLSGLLFQHTRGLQYLDDGAGAVHHGFVRGWPAACAM